MISGWGLGIREGGGSLFLVANNANTINTIGVLE